MKVDSNVKSVGGLLSTAPRPANGSTPRPAAPSSEQVELSPLSTRLQAIAAGVASEGVSDAGRVAEIKQAIAEGRFKVNPERIADGLLDDVRQMLSARG